VDDEVDDWDKPEEEDDWDPDFEEFDLPKSKGKKASTGGSSGSSGAKKGKGGDDDDLGLDDEFKDLDLFNDRGFDDDEEDF
jgi:DNA-directed RNA polymerase subunit delta